MKIKSFRIQNFRSIVDTGWRDFSPDNVTVLVGQNESGKSSILEAIAKISGASKVIANDIRIGEDLPRVSLRVQLDEDILSDAFDDYEQNSVEAFKKFLSDKKNIIEIYLNWSVSEDKQGEYQPVFSVQEEEIKTYLDNAKARIVNIKAQTKDNGEVSEEQPSLTTVGEEVKSDMDCDDFLEILMDDAPLITLFDQKSGLLPSQVDIIDGPKLSGEGALAAKNFLTVAGLNLPTLCSSDIRTRETLLARANAAITKEFNDFWSQTIGKKSKLKLECKFEIYSSNTAEKVGKSYLVFWIFDGQTKLSPQQRSQGVRWFVSFFLQLKASEKAASKRIFLLDEPGLNLHSIAQKDVLKLINKISKDLPIVYSTHSPHLIEYDKSYRILAVQRISLDDEDSPTEVKHSHLLGTASRDTLSPLLTAMGVDLTHQEVIKKKDNVILEEMSGYYYFKAFWELTGQKQSANFIAASGVDNIETFANMFRGWGLDFVVVVDDDPHGRKVYIRLKRDFFGDDEGVASASLMKIVDCDGIEDVFSKSDFCKFILNDTSISYDEKNSQYTKSKHLSKPVLAYSFLISVREKKIKIGNFDKVSQDSINQIVDKLANLLKSRPKELM